MKRLFALALVTALLRCDPGGAQTVAVGAPPAPGSGTTSSLGTLITTAPVGGTAIPLGSAQLYVGGLSPAPGDPNAQGDLIGASTVCLQLSTTGTAPDVLSSATDIIGTSGVAVNPVQSPGCVPPATGISAPGGLSSTPGSAAVNSTMVTSLGGGVIPLGATDVAPTGLSPPSVVPVPAASASMCNAYAFSLSLSAAALGTIASGAGVPGSTLSLPFGC
jgi:hypothetical protein